MKLQLTIGYLYGDLMNIYGDTGNIITLYQRGEWRDIEIRVKNISIGDKLNSKEVDLYFFGGGQDQAQSLVADDLTSTEKRETIKQDIEKGIPLLSICGGYQLLGEYYAPFDSKKLEGVGLFPVFTEASNDRMIGNIIIQTEFGKLIGFENHSGKTHLKPGAKPLGKVLKGFGNNGSDQTEGCVYKNAIGCYMHGSLLPKNPILADWLLSRALETKYGQKMDLAPLGDTLEIQSHQLSISRFSK